MLVVVSLGGNALLKRGEPLTIETQRANIQRGVTSISAVIDAGHHVVISHGNGPQIGLLALQAMAYQPDATYPLDVLGAETQGEIGYMIELALRNNLLQHDVATVLTQVEVDAKDPAFQAFTKPIGPFYDKAEAERVVAKHQWVVRRDGDKYRRVVPSPQPKRILQTKVIRSLVEDRVIVICAGGGGIPVIRNTKGGLVGAEAVVDKDWASALLATEVNASALLLLTDVEAVYSNWQTPRQKAFRQTTPSELGRYEFAGGSMEPKVRAASEFVEKTKGFAGIGRLDDALSILCGRAGTRIVPNE